jgi:hypothetical protein
MDATVNRLLRCARLAVELTGSCPGEVVTLAGADLAV